MHRESFPVNSVFCAQPQKFSHLKVLPYGMFEDFAQVKLYKAARSLISVSGPPFLQKMTRPPGFYFFFNFTVADSYVPFIKHLYYQLLLILCIFSSFVCIY